MVLLESRKKAPVKRRLGIYKMFRILTEALVGLQLAKNSTRIRRVAGSVKAINIGVVLEADQQIVVNVIEVVTTHKDVLETFGIEQDELPCIEILVEYADALIRPAPTPALKVTAPELSTLKFGPMMEDAIFDFLRKHGRDRDPCRCGFSQSRRLVTLLRCQ